MHRVALVPVFVVGVATPAARRLLWQLMKDCDGSEGEAAIAAALRRAGL